MSLTNKIREISFYHKKYFKMHCEYIVVLLSPVDFTGGAHKNEKECRSKYGNCDE